MGIVTLSTNASCRSTLRLTRSQTSEETYASSITIRQVQTVVPIAHHLWRVLIGAHCQGPTVRDKLFVFIALVSYAVTLTTSRKYELDSPTVR